MGKVKANITVIEGPLPRCLGGGEESAVAVSSGSIATHVASSDAKAPK
jgi:hypothetical protein